MQIWYDIMFLGLVAIMQDESCCYQTLGMRIIFRIYRVIVSIKSHQSVGMDIIKEKCSFN